ncbi:MULTISPECIES: SMI1/KNR4 family protein [Neptunomonas]|uniref:SMI1/KNR4 family protein n=1 Tax=Neptunomonas marina TaxID=1815562 RepID=A0A437Q665_9GAMM|nr:MULTISPECIES: SMI1/KNR4 family protein [Neptunomonas]RVU29985.1 SMI1/KNR4 family protein [Neptunomonas marina]
MNDIIDQLHELNEDRFSSMELPDEDLLVELEEEMLLPIPADLKEYLLYGSDVVFGSLSPVTASDPNAHTHLPEVTAVAWSRGLPRDLMPICEDLEGGYYVIASQGAICHWHSSGELEETKWETLWEWIAEVWINS